MKPTYRLLTIPFESDWLDLSPVSAETTARSVAAGEADPTVLIRCQKPYILLGPRDHRLPDLAAGVRYCEQRNLPVYDRIGGGSAVMLDETCVSFAVSRRCRDVGMVDRNYDELTAGVRTALRALGLDPVFGAAVGSYCEGPNDLLTGTRKIAGVAQSIRGGFALVSGMLLVRQDPARTTDLLNRFYAAAGAEPRLKAAVVTSIAEQSGRDLSTAEVVDRLVEGFADHFNLVPDTFTASEREQALALVPLRRVTSQR